jgi:hypothetical protein
MVMTHVTDVGTVAVRVSDVDPLSATRSSGNVAQTALAIGILRGSNDYAIGYGTGGPSITTRFCAGKDCYTGIVTLIAVVCNK